MYVVNIVQLKGTIACHSLACTLFFMHAQNHKHTSFPNATEADVLQRRKYKLFNWNIIPKVHSPLIGWEQSLEFQVVRKL